MSTNDKAITRPRWFYQGDKNPEYGGFWYRLDNWKYGYAEFVRITPCSDAGGPDNQFWIETGAVNGLDDAARVSQALDCQGQSAEDLRGLTAAQKRHAIACAFIWSGAGLDRDESRTVQIGPRDTSFDGRRGWTEIEKPDTVLRAGSDIARYVRRQFLRGA